MTPESLFSILNLIAGVSWLLLIVLPRPRWVANVIPTAVPVLFAAAYVLMIVFNWSSSEGGFSSLSGVSLLFDNPWLLLAGWTHYLAFDLFVGGWELRDARQRSVPHLALVPCLVLTFLFGPAGWLLYLGLRTGWRERSAQAVTG